MRQSDTIRLPFENQEPKDAESSKPKRKLLFFLRVLQISETLLGHSNISIRTTLHSLSKTLAYIYSTPLRLMCEKQNGALTKEYKRNPKPPERILNAFWWFWLIQSCRFVVSCSHCSQSALDDLARCLP